MDDQSQTLETSGTRKIVRAVPIDPDAAAARPSLDDARSTTEALHAARQAVETQTAAPAPAGEPAAKAVMEDVESVDIQLPDGRVVTMGPPPVPAIFITSQAYPEDKDAQRQMLARGLLYIRAIDAKPIVRPVDPVQFQMLANEIGDVGLDHVVACWQRFWKPAGPSDLLVLKKNLRGS